MSLLFVFFSLSFYLRSAFWLFSCFSLPWPGRTGSPSRDVQPDTHYARLCAALFHCCLLFLSSFSVSSALIPFCSNDLMRHGYGENGGITAGRIFPSDGILVIGWDERCLAVLDSRIAVCFVFYSSFRIVPYHQGLCPLNCLKGV